MQADASGLRVDQMIDMPYSKSIKEDCSQDKSDSELTDTKGNAYMDFLLKAAAALDLK